MSFDLTTFNWPQGRFRKLWAAVAAIVLVAVAVVATAPPVGAADPTVPDAPASLTGWWRSGEVTLSWTAPASGGGSPLTGYEYRYQAGGAVFPDTWTTVGLDLALTVDGLTNGVAHTIEVRGVNAIGNGSAASVKVMPLAPREGDIRITSWESGIDLPSWGPPEVYFDGKWGKVCDDNFFDVGNDAPAVACRQLGFADGMHHIGDDERKLPNMDYVMDDVWCDGCEGRLADCEFNGRSNNCYQIETVNIRCDTTGLGPPRSVVFVPGADQGTLVWNPPASDGGSPVVSYDYRYRTASGNFGEWTDAGLNLMATVANPTEGVDYRFEVRALNAAGVASKASIGTAVITGYALIDADTDRVLRALHGGETIQLGDYATSNFSIEAHASRGVGSVRLELSGQQSKTRTDDSAPYTLFGDRNRARLGLGLIFFDFEDGGFVDYTGERLAAGDYTLSATAYGGSNASGDALDGLTVSFALAARAPDAPRDLSAHRSGDRVALSWEAPDRDGGGAINRYEHRRKAGSGNFTAWTTAGSATSATFDVAAGITDHTYQVRGVNPSGTGDAATLVTPAVPTTPQNLSANKSGGAAALSWQAPAANGGTVVTGYEYRYSETGSLLGEWTSAGPVTTVTVSDLEAGVDHSFEVRAANAAGVGPAAGLSTGGVVGFSLVRRFSRDVLQPLYEGAIVRLSDYASTSFAIEVHTSPTLKAGSVYIEMWLDGYEPPPLPPGLSYAVPPPPNHFLGHTELGNPWSAFGENNSGNLVGRSLNPGTYRIRATAYEHDWKKGANLGSLTVNFTIIDRDPEPPSEPRNLEAHRDKDGLTLFWDAPENNGGAIITGYQHRNRASDDSTAQWSEWSTAGRDRTVTLANGAAATHEVRAVNAADLAGAAVSLAVPAPPGPPASLLVERSPGGDEATLTWTPPRRNGGQFPTGYEYRFGELAADSDPWDSNSWTAWTNAGTALTATISGLQTSAKYVVEARALSDGVPSPATRTSTVVIIFGFTLLEDGNQSNSLDLVDGATVVLADYGVNDFAIRADLSGESKVGKVDLELSGADIYAHSQTEQWSPYSLYGDDGPDDLHGRSLAIGDYNLSATVYGKESLGGTVLGKLEISFSVVANRLTALQQVAAPNTRATGQPTITGRARVGQTLTADTSGITDDTDGLDNAVFTYQWVRSEGNGDTYITEGNGDTYITEATGDTYTLVAEDEGQTIKVRVSFTDDAGNAESLTSDPTGAVIPDPGPLTTFTVVDTSTDPDKMLGTLEDGIALTLAAPAGDIYGIRVDTDSNHDDHDDIHKVVLALSGAKDVSRPEKHSPYSLYGDSGADNLTGEGLPAGSYDLKATAYKQNGDVLGTLKVSFSVAYAAPAEEQQPARNTLATGAPTIDGTARVGETLTADTSGIIDDEGLTNVAFSYQWIRSDGGLDTNITGATGATYTLVAADEDRTLKVTVSFTDGEGNPESLTSDPTGEVEAKPNTEATGAPTIDGIARVGETLTADTLGIDDDDGLENVAFSYQWLRGNAEIASATGETYTLTAADEGMTIKVKVSFTDAEGNPETLTSDPTGEVEAKPNTLATGAPTIDGIARVGETLTADTSGIHDDDGLENAALSYQWTRSDGGLDTNITGATGSTYTLVAADEGRTIKVTVSFTDAEGNTETLTSDPTEEVEAKPNTRATGLPTISGQEHVGETLTADTSGINDDDGLDNAAFSYQWLRGEAEIAGAIGSSYTLTEDDEGQTIKVKVSFTDDEGHEETLTSDPTGAVEAAETVPGRPQDLDGEASAQGIALTWEAPSGSAVTQYVVYRGELVNGSMNGRPMVRYATIDATGAAMQYTDANVEAGKEYRYRVAAVNSAGEGKKSTWINIFAEDS